jgi:glycosyltransferase involved in cell wall biosynthesis
MIPKISIAMCTYNGQRFLAEQLQSFLDQTVHPDELIVCDDGSVDDSVSMVRAFAARAPFLVRVICNPKNLGYIRNFEQAIAQCTGDLIFLCDQDDVWVTRKIQALRDVFLAEPRVGLVLHDFVRINAEGGPCDFPEERYGELQLLGTELPDEVRAHGIRVFMLPSPRAWCGCMMAFRREWLSVLLPIYPGKGHDDYILKLLGLLTEVRFVGEPLIQYRMHSSNFNNHEVGRKAWVVFFLKLEKRLHNVRMGYSKKNFYRWIMNRIETTGVPVIRSELLEMYRRYAQRPGARDR